MISSLSHTPDRKNLFDGAAEERGELPFEGDQPTSTSSTTTVAPTTSTTPAPTTTSTAVPTTSTTPVGWTTTTAAPTSTSTTTSSSSSSTSTSSSSSTSTSTGTSSTSATTPAPSATFSSTSSTSTVTSTTTTGPSTSTTTAPPAQAGAWESERAILGGPPEPDGQVDAEDYYIRTGKWQLGQVAAGAATSSTTVTSSTSTITVPQLFVGAGRRLRIRPTTEERFRVGCTYDRKWVVSDEYGGEIDLFSATWSLEDLAGAVLANGGATVSDADDWDGRLLHTVACHIDLTEATLAAVAVPTTLSHMDVGSSEVGYYSLIIEVTLAGGGGTTFKIPVRLTDKKAQ